MEVPRRLVQASCRIFRLWTFFVLFLNHFVRIGEAAVPGPTVGPSMDSPDWRLPSEPDFCIGVCNPSGISNKHYLFEQFPVGWWHVAETQASKYQQRKFQKLLKSMSYQQERQLRSSLGHPAPLRAGSVSAGSWTGVLSFADASLRQIPCIWPHGEFQSGRVDVSVAFFGGLEVTAATVYCPPRGPTYPNALELSEALLRSVTEQVVYGRSGCRAILGDFNCPSGSLQAMQHWTAQGWCELQDFMQQTHGLEPRFTCKSATRPDQIWLSPELLSLITNVATWSIFPDHDVLIAGIRLPERRSHESQWRLPGRIPWKHLDEEAWNSLPEIASWISRRVGSHEGCEVAASSEASDAFRAWSQDFEIRASASMSTAISRADLSFHGRAKLVAPKSRRINPVTQKSHRPGESAQSCGFLNRAVARWFQQLRRLQSYKHAVASSRHDETFLSRTSLWQSIRRAAGFDQGFVQWWRVRPIQLQGSPDEVPPFPPGLEIATRMLEDFHHNYRRFESWQHQRRLESCKAKFDHTSKSLFAATRKSSPPALDHLEDTITQPIDVVDASQALVSVPQPFPEKDIVRWTLQNQPAWVQRLGDHYQIDSDLLLVQGQSLACTVIAHEPEVIHQRLLDLWSPRWNRHGILPEPDWNPILQFAREHLPVIEWQLHPISISDWKRAIRKFKTTAAAGPCGWTREDLLHLTDCQISHVLDFFASLEAGAPWPQQLTVGLIHCLQKRSHCPSINDYRPITVCSILYRVYAGIRAGQLLSQLAKSSALMQCGFIKHRQAADVWYFIGVCIELSVQHCTPVHGLVADLVKAYNTLPRTPVFECLKHIGVPVWFLQLWQSHLKAFTRRFIVHRSCGTGIRSSTGFAEGCPLSCVAMTVLDQLWHAFQTYHVPRALPVSYVDNLELVSPSLPYLLDGFACLRQFCSLLDLQIDHDSLYMWSTSAEGRKELKSNGYKVSLGARDLGGQVVYCGQLRNRILVSRIEDTLSSFQSLRGSRQSISAKKVNVLQVLLPRALHGCEAVLLGKDHIIKLRSHVSRALRWDRAGSSPIVRISLLNTIAIDPGWYQIWRCVTLFRRQCNTNQLVRDWWGLFRDFPGSQLSNGPFGKVVDILEGLGLQLDTDGSLWFSANGYVSLWTATDTLIRQILLRAYHNQQASLLRVRPGFEDLEGFDFSLTTSADSVFQPAEQEMLHIVRDGSFISNDFRSKFDSKKTVICVHCQVRDTVMHKYIECPRFDSLRGQHLDLFRDWDSFPLSFQRHGLVPDNPWRQLVWEALVSLPQTIDHYTVEPSGHSWHCFTDGSCFSPDEPEESLAAWAVVLDGYGTLSCGHLQGIQQCILRAEITAVISAIQWCKYEEGDLHLWVDNLTVVEHVRDLQRKAAVPDDFDHSDLWHIIAGVLQTSRANIWIHKAKGHDEEELCENPLEDFCRVGNDKADQQAVLTNSRRPPFFERLWERYIQFRRVWKRRVAQLTAYQVAIAQAEITDENTFEDDQFQDSVSHFDFEKFPNSAEVSVQLSTLSEGDMPFSNSHDAVFRQHAVQIFRWIISEDQQASFMRQVSLLEMYVCYRCSLAGKRPLLELGQSVTLFAVVSFASDFSYFKKVYRFICKWSKLDWVTGSVDLSLVRILNPQPARCLGWRNDNVFLALLSDFVGRRPVTSAQALARPWQP